MAAEEIRNAEQPELVPYWCLGKTQAVKIERIIPMYPVSKDEVNYDRLKKILSVLLILTLMLSLLVGCGKNNENKIVISIR